MLAEGLCEGLTLGDFEALELTEELADIDAEGLKLEDILGLTEGEIDGDFEGE